MARSTERRTIAAGAIGNVLEWYDFAIYGYFATAIGRAFFPASDPVAQVLAAFGIFAVGYLMRPLGGLLIGHIGDRFGRRAALNVSVLAMAVPTFLVGALPDHDTLGVMAPVLLTGLRMVQGLSVGGEYTTSVVFMVENARSDRRGFVGALACCGAIGGVLLGSATGAALGALLPTEALEAWGWRIPFLMGLVVGLAGFFVRRHVAEGAPAASGVSSPLRAVLANHKRLLLRLAGFSVFNAVGFYLMFVYIVSWLQMADGIAPGRALEINSLSMAALLVFTLAAGRLSDRIGRRPVLLGGLAIGFLGAWPLLSLMHHADATFVILGQLGFAVAIGAFLGCQPATMVEAVPRAVRCTAIALGYNLCLGVVGGLTPLAAAWLVRRTHDDLAPAFLVMAAAVLSALAVRALGETRGRDGGAVSGG